MWQWSWALTGWRYDRDVRYPDGSSLYPMWAECVLAYPTCGEGEQKISVLRSHVFKILHTCMHWEIVHVKFPPCDCSVYIWYDDFIIPFPQVDGPLTAACSLILSRHAKYHIIWTVLQLQVSLQYKVHKHTHTVLKLLALLWLTLHL